MIKIDVSERAARMIDDIRADFESKTTIFCEIFAEATSQVVEAERYDTEQGLYPLRAITEYFELIKELANTET